MKLYVPWNRSIFLAISAAFITGCQGTSSSVGVGYSIYGGYGYGYYPPYYRPPYRPGKPDRPDRPNRPDKPDRPDRPDRPNRPKPERPIARPDRPTTKPSRPSMGRPSGMTSRSMQRPAGGMSMRRR